MHLDHGLRLVVLVDVSPGHGAPGERDGLALDEVLVGGLGVALPEDEYDVVGPVVPVAAVAGDMEVEDGFPGARRRVRGRG